MCVAAERVSATAIAIAVPINHRYIGISHFPLVRINTIIEDTNYRSISSADNEVRIIDVGLFRK